MNSELLRLEGIASGYGPIPVISEIDLVVRPGEVVALMGANGAGKSTLLLTIAGELTPLAGTMTFQGRPLKGPVHRRSRQGIAFVTEERSVFMQLSTRDNLRLGSGGIDPAIELMPELGRLLGRRAGLLSGGEQQILTLGRALAREPSLLLADELSLGLAPLVVRRLLDAVKAAADHGVGVLLVEQHISIALDIADRAYVLRRGRVVMSGTSAELRDRQKELEESYLTRAEPAQGGVRS